MAPRVMWAVFTVAVLLVCGAVGAEGADARMDPSPAAGLQEHKGREGRDPVLREVVQALHDHEELAGVAGALDARGRDVLHAILRAEASPPAQYTSSAVRGEMDSAEDGGTTGSRDVDAQCSGEVVVTDESGFLQSQPDGQFLDPGVDCAWLFEVPALLDGSDVCLVLDMDVHLAPAPFGGWSPQAVIVSERYGTDEEASWEFAGGIGPISVRARGRTMVYLRNDEWGDISHGVEINHYLSTDDCSNTGMKDPRRCDPYTKITAQSGFTYSQEADTYLPDVDCTWEFAPATTMPVCTRLHISGATEDVDTIVVSLREGDGNLVRVASIGGWFVDDNFVTTHADESLVVHFVTDGSVEMEGFSMRWEEVECTGLSQFFCAEEMHLAEQSGVLLTNGKHHGYPSGMRCKWVIEPERAVEDDLCIELTIQSLFVDKYDSISILPLLTDRNEPNLEYAQRFSGDFNVSTLPVQLPASAHFVVVEFQASEIRIDRDVGLHGGVEMTYRTTPDCAPHPTGCEHIDTCSECAFLHCVWCTSAPDHMAGETQGACMASNATCGDAEITHFPQCPSTSVVLRALRDLYDSAPTWTQSMFWDWDVHADRLLTAADWCEWEFLWCDYEFVLRNIDVHACGFPTLEVEEAIERGDLALGWTLPESLGRLSLHSLSLSGCAVVSFPSLEPMGPTLKHLSVDDNFAGLPPGVNHLHSVAVLMTDVRESDSLAFLNNMTMLRSLTLRTGRDTRLPFPETLDFALGLTSFQIVFGDCSRHADKLMDILVRVPRFSCIHCKLATTLPELPDDSVIEYLVLSHNRIHGTIPQSWTRVVWEILDLNDNELTGTIPRLSVTSTLTLSSNMLHGTIPEINGTADRISLSHNQLTGTIPRTLIRYAPGSFRAVNLQNNQLMGTLPEGPMKQDTLMDIHFARNRLSGTIPPSYCSYTTLDLSSNNLSGPLPNCTWLTRLGKTAGITSWHFGDNQLSGTIPEAIAHLFSHYTTFHAGNNLLEGTIPRGFWNLDSIYLPGNRLTGQLPDLPMMRSFSLNLSDNKLTGTIPAWLMSSAQTVRLARNALSGTLPPAVENANVDTSLCVFDLSGNNFRGSVGRGLEHCYMLDISDNSIDESSFRSTQGGLRHVRLRNNTIRNVQPVLMSSRFRYLREVDLGLNHIRTAILPELWATTSAAVIEQTARLEVMRLDGQHQGGLRSISDLRRFPNVQIVDLSRNALTHVSCSGVLWALRELHLHHNPLQMSAESISELLAKLPVLEVLSLSHTNVTGPLPDALFTNDKLRLADLRSSAFAIPYEPACDVDLNACLPRGLRRGELSPSADPSYSCYLPQHDATIRFEWNAYFAHSNCRCAEGFFGRRAVCHACVDGAMCPGGDAQMTMHAEAGFWGPVVDLGADTVHVSHDAVVVPDVCDGTSAMYRQCAPLHRHACATAGSGGVSSDASWQSCGGDGAYHGRMCSMCTADHFALGDECLACPSDGVFALLVLFSVAVLFGIVARALRTRHKRERAGTLSIALFYVQMIALLAWVGVPLSTPLSRLALLAAPFNLELPGWECVSAAYSFRGHFWMSVFTLPVLGVLVGGGAWLAARRGVRSASHTAVHVMTMLVLAKYMSASARVLRALGVEDGGCGVGTFFVHAPAVAADTPASRAVIGMAWMLLVVLVLGVPAWLVWVLRRKHGRQGAEHVTASSRQRYGGLFECYASRWWFWEAVVTLRKLLIAMVLGVSAYGSSMASFGVFVVLLLSAVLQRAVQPFADPLDNVLEYGSLAVLSANFALAMVFFSEDAAEGTRGLITAVLVLLNALMLVSFVFALARRRRAALLVAGRVKGSGRSRRHIGAQASLASMRSMASMREGALAAVAASDAAQGAGSSGGGSGGGGGGVRSSARAHQSPLLTNMFH